MPAGHGKEPLSDLRMMKNMHLALRPDILYFGAAAETGGS